MAGVIVDCFLCWRQQVGRAGRSCGRYSYIKGYHGGLGIATVVDYIAASASNTSSSASSINAVADIFGTWIRSVYPTHYFHIFLSSNLPKRKQNTRYCSVVKTVSGPRNINMGKHSRREGADDNLVNWFRWHKTGVQAQRRAWQKRQWSN